MPKNYTLVCGTAKGTITIEETPHVLDSLFRK